VEQIHGTEMLEPDVIVPGKGFDGERAMLEKFGMKSKITHMRVKLGIRTKSCVW
jgi:hypothetical protein